MYVCRLEKKHGRAQPQSMREYHRLPQGSRTRRESREGAVRKKACFVCMYVIEGHSPKSMDILIDQK
jgi:hypothetical protein